MTKRGGWAFVWYFVGGLWILNQTGLDHANNGVSTGIGLYFIGIAFLVEPMLLRPSKNGFSGHSEQSEESPNRRFGPFLRSLDYARDDPHRRQRLFQQPLLIMALKLNR